MQVFQALVLGVVQGLTEFLPVSSSGHLVIVESIMGFHSPGVLFEVILHLGTLLAVLIYFRAKFLKLPINYYLLIGLGTIPAVIVGFLIKDYIDEIFNSTLLVGVALIITGFINLGTHRQKVSGSKVVRPKDSLIIGIFQAFAILPGVSRSGSTILAGRLRGLDKASAVQFSFLLSIPAIIGANILEIINHGPALDMSTGVIVVGFVSAAISGYIAIILVMKFITENKFLYFSYYAFVVGTLTIIFSL